MSRYGEPGVPYGAYPGQSGKPEEPYDPPSDPWGQGSGDLTAPQAPGGPPGYPEPPPGYAGAPPGYVEPLPGYAGPPPGYADPGPAAPPGYGAAPGPGEPDWDPDPGQAWNADPDPAWGPDPGGPGWDGPPPSAVPPPERRNALLFVAVGLLVLVVAAAVGYALYLLSGEGTPTANPTEQQPAPAPTNAPATPPASGAPESPQSNIGLNAAMARDGDCLTNLGTDVEPQLQIVSCDSDESGPVYQVLTRVDTRVQGNEREVQDASAQQICTDTEGYTHHYFEVSESLSFVLCMAEQAGQDDE